jgi:hypothetical protein
MARTIGALNRMGRSRMKVTIEAEGFRDATGAWRAHFHVIKDCEMVVKGTTEDGRPDEEDALQSALFEALRLGMFVHAEDWLK